jgi:hypothetical protein
MRGNPDEFPLIAVRFARLLSFRYLLRISFLHATFGGEGVKVMAAGTPANPATLVV